MIASNTVPLSKLCKVFTDGNWIESKDQATAGIRLVQTGNVGNGIFKDRREKARFIDKETFIRLKCQEIYAGDCLVSRLPDPVGRSCIIPNLGEQMITAVDCSILRFDNNKVKSEFFNYYSQSRKYLQDVDRLCTGATRRRISRKNLGKIEIPLPSLAEQQRIVAILDEAFAGIDAAIENTKRNLANARELFESYLNNVITQKGEGWIEKKLGDVAAFRNGLNFTKSSRGEVIQIVGVKDFKNHFYVQTAELDSVTIDGTLRPDDVLLDGDILTVRSNGNKDLIGRCLLVQNIDPNTSHSGFTIRIRILDERVSPEFIVHYLKSKKIRQMLIDSGDGANINSLNQQALTAIPLVIPAINEQIRIVGSINETSVEAINLQSVYRQKLDLLTELKQSILQKAFSGELTSSIQTASSEFSAHIIAFAYARHRSNRRNKTFGRVKAQKTLQLVESIGGIDLGRVPIKDAAGPNDSAHMRQAENWAVANDYFEFVPRGDGYDFRQRSGFDKRLVEGCARFEQYRSKIERVVDLLLPMDSEKAEVFATVHAAWNNLVSDGLEVTDQKILWEARDNWHAGKLDIPEEKFREAIRYIRSNNLIPDGTAKIVKGQESLF
ncbi:MAG: restriction endonuclease subunit S [Sneathiella sp.]